MAELHQNAESIELNLKLIHDTLLPKLHTAKKNAQMKELTIQMVTAITMLIVIMALVGALRSSFESFINLFHDAKTKKSLIPEEELPYSEFKVMAKIANDMISSRFNAEDQLQDLNENLETRVEEATRVIQDLNMEITNTQSEVVFTMGAIGESRSKETGNHVKRVAKYSYLLAIKYGMPEDEARLLEQASPMHDIGKVGIPDAILKKPGKLTEEEFKIMKTHAVLGYGMLNCSERPIFKTAAIVANEHHEKWNGKGYPQGTAGEAIHIYGRITALADVFDALGSDRIYKKAWPDEKIFALIKEESGEHFDPKIVDIFLENLDEFREIREAYRDQDA
ncbi:MAG: HD domain-containing protein [Kiritimatiellae bacterium]|nr:HD domain-containing protein [Kiritimatiellia bacterium]